MGSERRRGLYLAFAALLLGCGPSTTTPGNSTPSPLAAPRTPAVAAVELTLLYTSDEHGWVLPQVVRGTHLGGVQAMLAMLQAEGHCTGEPLASARQEREARCRDSRTVLLSGGDNFMGPAISGLQRGLSMATAMRRLGYDALAFGNHELDYGHEALVQNDRVLGAPRLAANMVRDDGEPPALARPYVILQRAGVKLGVIGLATEETLKTAAPHRFVGLRFEDPKTALDRVVPEVWAAGADAVVVIAHECHDVIAPLIAANPGWHLSFVGTGHCHRTSVSEVGGTVVLGPTWRLEHYGRVRLRIDPARPPRERASVVGHELVEISGRADRPPPSVDAAFDAQITTWDRGVTDTLGQVVGHTNTGLAQGSAEIGGWITGAWRQRFGADIAITTSGAVRDALPPGPITLTKIHSIMPFENDLVVCRTPGHALRQMLRSPRAVMAGATRRGDDVVLDDGTPLESERIYKVVTTDFLFYGGDGFPFNAHDQSPIDTGVSWREPVIEWTRSAETSPARPLETLLR